MKQKKKDSLHSGSDNALHQGIRVIPGDNRDLIADNTENRRIENQIV
jgi:hypothetical protein